MKRWSPGSTAWRPVASGMPSRIRCTRTPVTVSSPRNASGWLSHTNSMPSSCAFFTSRIEPGMFAWSRRYRHTTRAAPCRAAVRTQSIAVSPPPITTTRLPAASSAPLSNSGTSSPKPLRLLAVRYSMAGTIPASPLPGPPMSRALYTPVAISTASCRARSSAKLSPSPMPTPRWNLIPPSSSRRQRRSTTSFSSLKPGMP